MEQNHDNLKDENCTTKIIYEFQPYKIEKIEYRKTAKNSQDDQAEETDTEGEKKEMEIAIPTARSGHRSVCTEGYLYSLGGFNPEHRQRQIRRRRPATSIFQELWKFNFATREWKLCLNSHTKNMPEELASNAVTLKNNSLIAFGGTAYPFGEACSNQCYVFTLDTPNINVVRLQVDGDLPTPQYGPAVVVHDNYLYTIGGTTGFEYSCDIFRLNLITKQWETVYICKSEDNGDPSGRYRHEIVYTGKLIYILGGGTADTAFNLLELPAFDLETNSWIHVKTKPDINLSNSHGSADDDDNRGYPGPRKCHSCIQYETHNNEIEAVIAGGYTDNDIYYSDIWKINFRTMQWQYLSTAILRNPIYFHSAATFGNGCMYLFGGIEIQRSLKRTNDLYKVWTKIPKLSEMCWDAICYYNPNIDSYTKSELVEFGIPRKFVNRVYDENSDNGN